MAAPGAAAGMNASMTDVDRPDADRFAASLSDDDRYRLLIEAVTDYAIYMLDPSGIVTSWNTMRLTVHARIDLRASHL